MRQQFTSIECPNCYTLCEHLPIDYDEDGYGYAALEVTPCAECGVRLCECCNQFACDGCGETFCETHQVAVPDGTDRPLRCCAACAAECEPARIPAQRELVAASTESEVA